MPTPTAELELSPELYAQAAEATAEGSKSFYFATRFFPPELARSAHAVYWFCRYSDDLVDLASSREQGSRDLAEWHQALGDALHRNRAQHPVLQAFAATVRKHQIPAEYAFELLEGMRMDLEIFEYATFEELRVFCYRVASVVGLMMSHVIGFKGNPLQQAIDLGIAMQLTNILRDVGEDLDRGHIYLPIEDLERFGYSKQDLQNRVRNSAFEDLIRFEIARARDYYERAQPGISALHPDGRFAVQIASDVYAAILNRIERSHFEVFDQRAVVSQRRKYWITARRMTGPILRTAWHRTFGGQA